MIEQIQDRQVDVVATLQPDVADRPDGDASFDRRPGDGRRRIFAVLADCADWRLTEYLRARGELPFQDHLFARGHRSVLESRPAFTAAAMQALVWPSDADADPGAPSLRWMHQLGLELAGLEAVGRNPLDALSWVLPQRQGLFDTIGAGPYVTAKGGKQLPLERPDQQVLANLFADIERLARIASYA